MKYENDISIIVPYKPDGGYRDMNWSWIKRRYSCLMPNAEICIGNDNSEPFSKSSSINKAANFASGDILIIADADILFDPIQVEAALNNLSSYAWITPFVNRIELGEKDSMELISKDPNVDIENISFSDYKITQPGVGSICILKHEAFDIVKGFDERFKGWGGEDCAFEMSLETLCGQRYQPPGSKIWHLYHPQPVTLTYQSPTYPANYALYERYLGANGKVELMKALIDEK